MYWFINFKIIYTKINVFSVILTLHNFRIKDPLQNVFYLSIIN